MPCFRCVRKSFSVSSLAPTTAEKACCGKPVSKVRGAAVQVVSENFPVASSCVYLLSKALTDFLSDCGCWWTAPQALSLVSKRASIQGSLDSVGRSFRWGNVSFGHYLWQVDEGVVLHDTIAGQTSTLTFENQRCLDSGYLWFCCTTALDEGTFCWWSCEQRAVVKHDTPSFWRHTCSDF